MGSGHATKSLIDIGAGVLDIDYNTKIGVSDHSTEAFSNQGQWSYHLAHFRED